MSTLARTSPYLGSALCVAMETMQVHIVLMGLLFRAINYPHLGVLTKGLRTQGGLCSLDP